MKICQNGKYQYLWLDLPEELDQHVADRIKRKCEIVLLDCSWKYIVFDFSKTKFMDSAGIGMILGRYRQIYPMGGCIFIFRARKNIKKLLEISGVSDLVKECEEKKEIIEHISEGE